VTPLAPRPASCRIVAALRRCEESRAGSRIIIPRACQALCIVFICRTADEETSVGGRDAKRWFYRPRFVGSRSGRSPFFVMHTWFPPVGIG